MRSVHYQRNNPMTSPIQVCCFCFSPILLTEQGMFLRGDLFDHDGGSEYLEFTGHEYCAERRHGIISDYTETLERNREDMPEPDKRNPEALQATSQTTEVVEDAQGRPKTPDNEVDRYFGKLTDTDW